MIARAQALAALASEPFDVVVIGGGITGAGVALDAASRGYSVALVEQADFASGTSSRSSKLVHGGLRYLQNFDLGLVREALLERQLMVKLAPHLVRPLPLVVPAFEGARPDRLVGIGLNLYDVMAVDKLRGRRKRREEAEPDEFRDWAPERHRVIPGRRGRRAAARARRRASRPPATSSTTARPTTRASSSRCSARPSASARSAPTGSRSPAWSRTPGAPAACTCATARPASCSTSARRTSSTRRASGPTGSGPRSCTTRPRSRGSRRAAARTSRSPTSGCR